jgi:hypothetical protein
MRKLLLAMTLILSATSFALAQNDYNKHDIYVGFSHARVDFDADLEGFNGFEVAANGNISRYIGLKADYAFHFKDFNINGVNIDAKTHTLVGGVQFKDNSTSTKIKPFAHLMAGLTNARAKVNPTVCIQQLGFVCPFSDSETGFAGVFGGGIDFRINDRVDFRAIQVDFHPARLGGETQGNFRVGVGVVFR